MKSKMDALWRKILTLKMKGGSAEEIRTLQQMADKQLADTLQVAMEDNSFANFVVGSHIEPIDDTSFYDVSKLHDKAVDVIVYQDKYYIEILSNGYYLYRPSGKGFGKRSKNLETIERYVHKKIN